MSVNKPTAKVVKLPKANIPQSIRASENGYYKLPKPNLGMRIRKGL